MNIRYITYSFLIGTVCCISSLSLSAANQSDTLSLEESSLTKDVRQRIKKACQELDSSIIQSIEAKFGISGLSYIRVYKDLINNELSEDATKLFQLVAKYAQLSNRLLSSARELLGDDAAFKYMVHNISEGDFLYDDKVFVDIAVSCAQNGNEEALNYILNCKSLRNLEKAKILARLIDAKNMPKILHGLMDVTFFKLCNMEICDTSCLDIIDRLIKDRKYVYEYLIKRYEDGDKNVQRLFKEIIEQYNSSLFDYISKRAEDGDMKAQFYMGCHNFNSEKVDDGIFWFKKAADLGHADAQFYLGCYNFNEEKIDDAIFWFKKAADLGHAEAKDALDELLKNGSLK